MNKAKKPATGWPKVRKFFNDIHLWGGLLSGIVVFVVCLTGTIYVYNTELREMALPSYYKVEASGERMSVDSLLQRTTPAIKGKISGVRIPHAETATVAILYNKPRKEEDNPAGEGRSGREARSDKKMDHEHGRNKEKRGGQEKGREVVKKESNAAKAPAGGGRRRSNQLMVNPYSGDIIGDVTEVKTKTADFMQTMFGLHRWLLLNEVEEPLIEGVENRKLGSWITGTATLLFLLGVLTGIIIWFPKKMRSWKNGLKIKWSASWKRVNHDLHNTLGLYTWIVLLLMAVTGPFWSFDWYREGWQKTWGTHASQQQGTPTKAELSSVWAAGNERLSLMEIMEITDRELPYAGDLTVNFPSDSVGTISIAKNRVGFFAPSAGDKLVLDQYSGQVLEKDIFAEKNIRNRIGSSIKAMHVGDVYGPFTKLLYFISCLIATSLPVTGVLIWVNKMKKTKKKV